MNCITTKKSVCLSVWVAAAVFISYIADARQLDHLDKTETTPGVGKAQEVAVGEFSANNSLENPLFDAGRNFSNEIDPDQVARILADKKAKEKALKENSGVGRARIDKTDITREKEKCKEISFGRDRDIKYTDFDCTFSSRDLSASYTDADVLALEISAELLPPQDLVRQITSDLEAIRAQAPHLRSIGARSAWAPGQLIVELTEAAIAELGTGDYHGFR